MLLIKKTVLWFWLIGSWRAALLLVLGFSWITVGLFKSLGVDTGFLTAMCGLGYLILLESRKVAFIHISPTCPTCKRVIKDVWAIKFVAQGDKPTAQYTRYVVETTWAVMSLKTAEVHKRHLKRCKK